VNHLCIIGQKSLWNHPTWIFKPLSFYDKVRLFWESHKFLQNLHLSFVYSTIKTKVRWRLYKILWPSQNIWTLNLWFFSSILITGSNKQFRKYESNLSRIFWPIRRTLFFVFSYYCWKMCVYSEFRSFGIGWWIR